MSHAHRRFAFHLALGACLRRTALAVAFCALALSCFGTANAGEPDVTYRIRPGDALSISVLGVESMTKEVIVLGDGTVDYAIAGTIPAAGLKPSELARTIENKIKDYVLSPVVTVSVARPVAFTVQVLGNVNHPGRYPLERPARVTDAVAAAGGLGTFEGTPPNLRIVSSSGKLRSIPISQLFYDGDSSLDAQLNSGDAIYIPSPRTFSVEVAGNVARSGEVQLHQGDRLSYAVAKAGIGSSEQPDLNHVFVTRTGENGATSSFDVNLYESLKSGDSTNDIPLIQGDVVYVPKSKRAFDGTSTAGGGALSILRALIFHI